MAVRMKKKNTAPHVFEVNKFNGDDACDEVRRGHARSRLNNVTRSTALSAVRPTPRRGLSRDEAAMYIGISASKFDELVRDGRMPGPKQIDGRKLWDVHAPDLAFDSLPDDNDQRPGIHLTTRGAMVSTHDIAAAQISQGLSGSAWNRTAILSQAGTKGLPAER